MKSALKSINTQSRLSHPQYRADIDGLRALAVISVVGYHAFPNIITGGFIGVDIFFVISGFLISSIIFGSLQNDGFSFYEFYSRRIRRIFPALILILLASFIFGWLYLFATEYKQLGKHIAGGAGFISNFLFWQEAGYFDNSAETKPLLHLWSLGIEEQFYIVWPLVLWFAWKKRLNQLNIILAAILISFVINIAITKTQPVAAFYFPLARMWELMLGSLLAYLTLHYQLIQSSATVGGFFDYAFKKFRQKFDEINVAKLKDTISIIGGLLLIIAILFITNKFIFPGWWVLLPTLGAVLILASGANSWFNRKILSSRILIWFGLISYPLYLWHWPILSFMRVVGGVAPDLEYRIAAIILSIFLAWITYRLVEKPLRFGKDLKWKTALLCMLMSLVAYAGYYAYQNEGVLERRFAKNTQSMLATIKRTDRESECFDIANAHSKPEGWFCHLNKGAQPHIFVFGDSHVLSLFPAFEKIARDENIDILFAGFSGCPPLLGIRALRGDQKIRNCQELNKRIYNYAIQNNVTDVYLVARWTYYTDGRYDGNQEMSLIGNSTTQVTKAGSRKAFQDGIIETVEKFANAGITVHIVKDVPLQLRNPNDLIREIQYSGINSRDAEIEKLSVSARQHKEFQSFVNSSFASVEQSEYGKSVVDVVDLDDVYCNKSSCPFAKGDVSYYYDTDHLSVSGALLSTSVIASRFK